MTMTSSEIVHQLNVAWQAIQDNNPEVPDAMIVTSRRRHKSEANVLGQHCRETWHVPDFEGRLAEITIFGERLADGGAPVLQTLLHEAAHALAGVRDIKDTSNRNRFHNKKFVALAEELGLEGPAESGGPALGFSMCTLRQDTFEKYKDIVYRLEETCTAFVVPPEPEEPAPKKPRQKAFCSCPSEKDDEYEFESITWTKALQKKLDNLGIPPLLCGICRQAYIPDEDYDPEAV